MRRVAAVPQAYCVLGVSRLLIGEAMEVGDIHSSVRLRACHNKAEATNDILQGRER
jgi:hypothetical protein